MPTALDVLDPKSYATTRVPVMEAETLPPAAYTSQEFYELEVERIFMREWNYIGRADRVPNPGDYFTLDFFGVPIIVARDQKGELRAFLNSCRHRGSEIVSGEGSCKAFKCPYHSWAYSLDGTLLSTNEMQKTKNFDPSRYGLIPARLGTWDGFLFMNLDPDGISLEEHLGGLPSMFACYHLREMVCVRRKEWDIVCNWKLIIENGMEELHVATVHRKTIQQYAPTDIHEPDEVRGQCAVLRAKHEGSMALLKGDTGFPRIETLVGKAGEGTYFALVYPTTTFTFTSDCVWTSERWPRGPHRTTYVHSAYFPKSRLDRPDFEEVVARYYKRWDTTIPEDVAAAERQHRGLNSPFSPQGRFSYRETIVHAVDNWWLDRIFGPAG
jgi:phenylpropionate dioxygenase-like ring-hydroxylating dioxygenase large terminal subunit